jgi:hypothetical protein
VAPGDEAQHQLTTAPREHTVGTRGEVAQVVASAGIVASVDVGPGRSSSIA